MEQYLQTLSMSPELNGAVSCLLLYIFMKIFFKKDSISKIQKRLDNDEYLICDITPVFFFDYLLSFVYGFHFKKILTDINLNNPLCVILSVIFIAGGALLLMVLASPKTFISNKRIICEPGFFPLIKKENKRKYHYCNITKCREKWTIFGKKFIIDFKTNPKSCVMYKVTTFYYNVARKILLSAYESSYESNLIHIEKEPKYAKTK